MAGTTHATVDSSELEQAAYTVQHLHPAPNVSGRYLMDGPFGTIDIDYRQREMLITGVTRELTRGVSRVRSVIEGGLEGHRWIAAARDDQRVVAAISATLAWEFFPELTIWDKPQFHLAMAEAAIKSGNLTYGAQHLTQAATLADDAYQQFDKYRRAVIRGAERAVTGLEVVRDTSAITVGIIATVTTGGTAGALISAGYGAAQNVAQQATELSLGLRQKIDWAGITFDAVFGLVTGLGAGKLGGMITKGLLGNPALAGVSRKMIANVVGDVISGKVQSQFQAATKALFDRARGERKELTGDQLLQLLAEDLKDPKGWLMPVVAGEAGRRAHAHVGGGAGRPAPSAEQPVAPTETPAAPAQAQAPISEAAPATQPAAPVSEAAPASLPAAPVSEAAPVSQPAAPASEAAPMSQPAAPVHEAAPPARTAAPAGEASAPAKAAPVAEPAAPASEAAPARRRGGTGRKRASAAREQAAVAKDSAAKSEPAAKPEPATAPEKETPAPKAEPPSQEAKTPAEQPAAAAAESAKSKSGSSIEDRVTFGAPDEYGRATYVVGEIQPMDLHTGSATGRTYPPGIGPGEVSTPKSRSGASAAGPVEPQYRAQRGHLLGDLFGGKGTDPRNLAWMHEITNLSTFKTEFENPVRASLERGESVKFSIEPKYRPGEAVPHAIEVWASSSSGETIVPHKTILNPGLSDIPLPAAPPTRNLD